MSISFRTTFTWLGYATIGLFISSCSRYYYQASPNHAPLLHDKNDAHLTASFAEDDATVLSLQAAYSPIKHLGVIGGISSYNYAGTEEEEPASSTLWELGLGGYYPFPLSGDRFKLVIDLYGGYGSANLSSDVNMRLTKVFIQPGIGFRTDYFDLGLNLKIGRLSYSNFDQNGKSTQYLMDQRLLNDYNQRIDQFYHWVAEPAITLRGGYKFVKAQLQAIAVFPVSPIPWTYKSGLLSFGLYFSLEDLLRFSREAQL